MALQQSCLFTRVKARFQINLLKNILNGTTSFAVTNLVVGEGNHSKLV